MAKIQCSQCGYFTNCISCSRYTITVEKDTTCVDCDESDEPAEHKVKNRNF